MERRRAAVRELVLANVEYWVREYHVDGFRLDATQQIFDASAEHVLAALAERARAAAGDRQVVIIAENEDRSRQSSCVQRIAAAVDWTGCTTTTSITPPASR